MVAMQCFRICISSLVLQDITWLTESLSAQGAAQAVEDGAVLGELFKHIQRKNKIEDTLRLYQRTRKPRAQAVNQKAHANRAILNMQDGESQEARDRCMKDREPPLIESRRWLFEYDASEQANREWESAKSAKM